MKKIKEFILVLTITLLVTTSGVFAETSNIDFASPKPVCYVNIPVPIMDFIQVNNGVEITSIIAEPVSSNVIIDSENQTVTFTNTNYGSFTLEVHYRKSTGESSFQFLSPSIYALPEKAKDAPPVNLSAFAHVENIGDQVSTVGSSISIGTTGQCLQMEGFTLKTDNPNVIPVYEAHVEDYGWMPQVENGAFAGTRGEHKRIECFKISLTGPDAEGYDIYYRAHVQDYGWLDWAKNGQSAGTSQHAFRCEALELIIQPKGQPAPGGTDVPAVEAFSREEGQMIFLVNQLRVSEGQKRLTGDPILHEVVKIRAEELNQLYSHTRPDGRDCFSAMNDYLQSNGINWYDAPYFCGENICSQSSIQNGFDSWNASPPHHENMVRASFKYFAYAIASGPSLANYRFAAQNFGL